jgi:hypothetical protein
MTDHEIQKLKEHLEEMKITIEKQQRFCNWVFGIFNTICIVLSIIIIIEYV